MALNCPAIISEKVLLNIWKLLVTPVCSSGRNDPVTRRARNCFWTLSCVERALCTLAWVVGSMSGTSIEKETSGLLSLPVMAIPQSIVLLEVDVVSEISVPMDAFVL